MTGQRGFSLMELMVVVILIGIVMAASIPNFTRYRRTLVREQSRGQVLSDVRSARQRAVTQHMPVIVAFGNGVGTTNLTTYSIHGDTNGDRVLQAGEYWVQRKLPKITVLSKVSLSPVDTLLFDNSGILKPGTLGGTIILKTNTAVDTLNVSVAGTVYSP